MQKKETRGRKKIYKTEKARKKAIAKSNNEYNKRETTCFTIRFANKRDATVIEHLKSQSDKSNYIRQLILKDIEKKEDN